MNVKSVKKLNPETLKNVPSIMVTAQKGDDIVGFVLSKVSNKTKIMNVHILCAQKNIRKGVGTELMNTLMEEGKRLGIEYVKLEPIPGTESFYKRLGFKNGDPSTNDSGKLKITPSKYRMYKQIKGGFLTDLFKKLRFTT